MKIMPGEMYVGAFSKITYIVLTGYKESFWDVFFSWCELFFFFKETMFLLLGYDVTRHYSNEPSKRIYLLSDKGHVHTYSVTVFKAGLLIKKE